VVAKKKWPQFSRYAEAHAKAAGVVQRPARPQVRGRRDRATRRERSTDCLPRGLSGLVPAGSIKLPHQFFEKAAGALRVHRHECVRRHSEGSEVP
jgi:hypothetical protein